VTPATHHVVATQLELVGYGHDKFYRTLALTGPAHSKLITQYGRRGAQGQISVKRDNHPESAAASLHRQKQLKGYNMVVPPLRFTWTGVLSPDTTPQIADSGLLEAFVTHWTSSYDQLFATLAHVPAPAANRSIINLKYSPRNYRVWPWLARLRDLLLSHPHHETPLAHHETPLGLLAIVPDASLTQMTIRGVSFDPLDQALPEDSTHTLEVFAGIWTPGRPGLDTVDPTEALDVARRLVPA
jgi:predicted DNA-binding WGR domain protein